MVRGMSQKVLSNHVLMEIIQIQTEIVKRGLDLSRIMDLVTQRAQQITKAHGACLELLVGDELMYSASSGMAESYLGLRLSMKNSLSGECIHTRTSLICNNVDRDVRVNKEACHKIGLQSMIVTPLICEDDVVGVLKVLSSEVHYFTQESIQILELMSDLIAAAMFYVMKNEASELYQKATHDSLTGISNRFLFYERLRQNLSQAMLEVHSFGMISLDMDGLKEVNDQLGHRAGDEAIREVVRRIKKVIQDTDTFSRLGGDEFGILITSVIGKEKVEEIMFRIKDAMTAPLEFEQHHITLSVSMGCAMFEEDGRQLEELIEKADQEMYEMKRRHKKGNHL